MNKHYDVDGAQTTLTVLPNVIGGTPVEIPVSGISITYGESFVATHRRPRTARQDERHVGVKFGDQGPFVSGEYDELRHWHCTLDGVEVANNVKEAFAGRDDGWVMMLTNDYRAPRWGWERISGDVRVWTCLAKHHE